MRKPSIGIYCIEAFCVGSDAANLCMSYKTRANANKSFNKRVDSGCYERVVLYLVNIVYCGENALILKEYSTKQGGPTDEKSSCKPGKCLL